MISIVDSTVASPVDIYGSGVTSSAREPRGTASDALMLQVSPANVLQVRAAFVVQRQAIETATAQARRDFSIVECGGDPVSRDYTPEFRRKLFAIAEVHQRHAEEIAEAIQRLDEAAREYGLVEDEVTDSFAGAGGLPER